MLKLLAQCLIAPNFWWEGLQVRMRSRFKDIKLDRPISRAHPQEDGSHERQHSLEGRLQPMARKCHKADMIARMIGKTRAAEKLMRSQKKRVALSIMSSPLQKMSLGAKQYAMAVAMAEAQKKIKVQPVGFFTAGDEANVHSDDFPVSRIHWGTVETKLVSYDIPFALSGDRENERVVTTERETKIVQMIEVYNNVKSNLRQYSMEKQGIDAESTT